MPVCAHCRTATGLWRVELTRGETHLVCRVCGGVSSDGGRPLVLSSADGSLSEDPGAPPQSAALPSPNALVELEGRAVVALARLYPRCDRPDLAAYVAGVRTELVRDRVRFCVLLDVGDPFAAGLPAGGLAVSLGLLAVLRDEAQLAFVLAREIAIAELGLPAQRLGLAKAGEGLIGRLRRGAGEARLSAALKLSLALGWGPDVEMRADQLAVERLVAAGYSPQGSLDALRALEEGSLEGRCGRFLAWDGRGRALERRLSLEPPAHAGRLNAEVYRRAVGGFAVFGA